MSRKISSKIIVKGTLTALTPISVGGLGGGDHVDIELAEDASGAYCIPGTGLAGPMRAWLEERADDDIVKELFGYIKPGGEDGAASSLFIEDSRVDGSVIRERRHGISIDAESGTTKKGFFYTRALLPRGTCFPLNMELDIFDEADKKEVIESALSGILTALQRGEIRFGACKTRGMGRVKLDNLNINRYDFVSDPAALDNWLNDNPSSSRGDADMLSEFSCSSEGADIFETDIPWRAVSPIMVKAGRDGIETDMLPLMSGVGGEKIAPVIPGSSLKGVLRSQAERILRTIFDGENENAKKLVDNIFGSEDNAGLLSVDDVYYNTADDIRLSDWLSEENLDKTPTEKHQYVAIDRFTGGASDGALYSARPVKASADSPSSKGKWDPIHMALRLPKGSKKASRITAAALIKLLLRDMRDGYISIGFGSRRGMGAVTADMDAAVCGMGEHFPSVSELQSAWDEFVRTNGACYESMINPERGEYE